MKLINIIFLILLKDTPEKSLSPGKEYKVRDRCGSKESDAMRFYLLVHCATREYIRINCT